MRDGFIDEYIESEQGVMATTEPNPISNYSFDEDLGGTDVTAPLQVGPGELNIEARVNALFDPLPEERTIMFPDTKEERAMRRQEEKATAIKDNKEEVRKYDHDFTQALMGVENGIMKGYENGKWTPHKSSEGGNRTLAYGHKITPAEKKKGTVNISGKEVDFDKGLTEEQAKALLQQDMEDAEKRLNKSIPDYESLDERYKNVLISLSFNVGNVDDENWPNLLIAARAGDEAGIRKEMVSGFYDRQGNWNKLLTRAKKIADSQGLSGGQPLTPPQQSGGLLASTL